MMSPSTDPGADAPPVQPLRARWPAEWEPHRATWLSWPKNRETWPEPLLPEVETSFARMVEALSPGEAVCINVDDAREADRVRRALAAHGVRPDPAVRFYEIPTDDAWVRDHGPLFVEDVAAREAGSPDPRVVLDFEFDAWGRKYPPWDRDADVARSVARILGLPVHVPGEVLEPGSIDGDGAGSVLTTEACLLAANRGSRSRTEAESMLARWLGAERVLWLGEGIAGDDTDGHVDDLTRFVSRDALVTAVAPDPSHPDHAALTANRRRLADFVDERGGAYRIAELPMPPVIAYGGAPLPASYANFYIANSAVLMPSFAAPSDARAKAVLVECFPDRDIVEIPATALVVGLGAVHCLTQQEPSPPEPT